MTVPLDSDKFCTCNAISKKSLIKLYKDINSNILQIIQNGILRNAQETQEKVEKKNRHKKKNKQKTTKMINLA